MSAACGQHLATVRAPLPAEQQQSPQMPTGTLTSPVLGDSDSEAEAGAGTGAYLVCCLATLLR